MIYHITDENEFDAAISEGHVLVDFYANWCGPCKMLSPIIEDIDAKNDVPGLKIIKVDTDNAYALCRRYGIASIPAIIVFRDGNISATAIGYMNKKALLDIINK